VKKYKKIIVWGAKLDTGHTHGFIHEAIVRAVKHMNIETYWLDNRDNVGDEFFDDAIIITEQWLVFANGASNKLPLRKSSCYLVHYLGNKGPVEGNPGASMYLDRVGKLIDFRFASNWGIDGIEDKNYAYKFEPEKYQRISDTAYYEKDSDYDKYYDIWATDLLPHEFDFEARFTEQKRQAFFCGTIREDNYPAFEPFIKKCEEHKIPFIYNTPYQQQLPTSEIRRMITSSLLPLDCRPPNHIANGYIACRAIKNISYGALGLTNSKHTYDLFDGEIAYAADSGDLFDIAREMQEEPKTKDLILNQMKKIQEKHTYINRVTDIITAAEI
jgi:hypothetical protein